MDISLANQRMRVYHTGEVVPQWEDVQLGRGVQVNEEGDVEVLARLFNVPGEDVHQILFQPGNIHGQ